ncbi:MAG TPA: hypothetical protein VHT91_40175 [Kofleriaceae bacterium]|jgi:hypothetical protein|nr:hypothetical protein [Kofleriaceae bacterium]
MTLMDQADYAGACVSFELSQRLDPQYGTALNLAVCYVRLNKLYAGWKLYQDVAVDDRDRQRAARAARAARELWPRIPKLRLRVLGRVSDLRITVDAVDVTALADTEIPIEVGPHVIEASMPGKRPIHQDMVLESGEERAVDLEFEPERPAPRDATLAALPRPTPSARASWSWVVIGSGGALVVGGLAAGWHARTLNNNAHDACQIGQCDDPVGARNDVSSARKWGDVASVTLALGVAAIGCGVYLWRTSRDHSVHIDVAAGPAAASVRASATF